MATTEQNVAVDRVRGVAREIDPTIRVELDGDEIVLRDRTGRIEERYDDAEGAIAGLRASWCAS